MNYSRIEKHVKKILWGRADKFYSKYARSQKSAMREKRTSIGKPQTTDWVAVGEWV